MNMKIKKFLTVALVAAAALTACEKNVNPGGNESENGNENEMVTEMRAEMRMVTIPVVMSKPCNILMS